MNVKRLVDVSYQISNVNSDSTSQAGSLWFCQPILVRPVSSHRKSLIEVTRRVTMFSLTSVLCCDHFSFQPELV